MVLPVDVPADELYAPLTFVIHHRRIDAVRIGMQIDGQVHGAAPVLHIAEFDPRPRRGGDDEIIQIGSCTALDA